MPLSIVVPCYMVAQRLSRCLDSLVSQTLRPIEVICVNDGSPDGSKHIIEKYAARYPDIIVCVDRKNGGAYRARQDGINHATGEYIGFVDGDDYVTPDYAETMYTVAKRENADMVVSGFHRVDEKTGKLLSEELCSPREPFEIKDDPGRILDVNTAPWNKVFHSSILKNMHELESPPSAFEDVAFHQLAYLQMTGRGRVAFAPKPLVEYQVHDESNITSMGQDQVEGIYSAFLEVRSYYLQDNAPTAMIEALDAMAFIHLGISMLFRLASDQSVNIGVSSRECMAFLDENFSTWRDSRFFDKAYPEGSGPSYRKMRIAHRFFKSGFMAQFLSVYRWFIRTFRKDIKW